MERKSINLHFGNEVYTYESRNDIPFKQGIYLVYPGSFNGNNLELGELIYIGKGDDTPIRNRVYDHHEKDYAEWRKYCKEGEDIYYRIAELKSDIQNVEAAMIYKHKPPCNTVGVDNYTGSKPVPNVGYDVALPPVFGKIVEALDLIYRMKKVDR